MVSQGDSESDAAKINDIQENMTSQKRNAFVVKQLADSSSCGVPDCRDSQENLQERKEKITKFGNEIRGKGCFSCDSSEL